MVIIGFAAASNNNFRTHECYAHHALAIDYRSISVYHFLQRCTAVLIIFFGSQILVAQQPMPERHRDSESGLEKTMEQFYQENGTSPEVDELDDLIRHPLDLAKMSTIRLLSLPGMSSSVARRIRNGIRHHEWSHVSVLCDSLKIAEPLRSYLVLGTFIKNTTPTISRSMDSTHHLTVVVNSSASTALGSTSYLPTSKNSVSNNSSLQPFDSAISATLRIRVMCMVEKTRGEIEGRMLGSPYDITQRLRISSPFLDAGVVCSKDAFEASLSDFVSGFIRVRPLEGVQCIVGDFLVDEGLGSLTSRSARQSKGSATTASCMRIGGGLLPSTGTLPLRMYRGAACQMETEFAHVYLRLWSAYSRFSRRAKLDSVTRAINTLDISDMHRTTEETAPYSFVNESSILGGCDLQWSSVRIGLSGMHRYYNRSITSDADGIPRIPTGKYVSAFAQYQLQYSHDFYRSSRTADDSTRIADNSSISSKADIWIQTEFVCDSLRRNAVISTLLIDNSRFTMVLRARSAHPFLEIPMASSLTEFGALRNEQGVYCGVHLRARRSHQWWAYVDVFRSLVPRLYMPVSSSGIELFGECLNDLSPTTSLRARATHRIRTESERSADLVLRSYREALSTARVTLDQQCSRDLRLSMRADVTIRTNLITSAVSAGSAIGMAIDYSLNSYIRFHARSTLASTDNFATAIYMAETAAPGTLRLVPLYNNGTRSTCTVELSPLEYLRIWLRAEITERNSTSSMGSSITETQGPRQRSVFLQVEVRR